MIQRTARATVKEVKRQGLLKDGHLGTFKKTERLLYQYSDWITSDNEEVKRTCENITAALEKIKDDPYYEIIDLKYFRKWTHERIAEHFDVDTSTISKQRTKLINRLRPLIFSEEFIKELYEM